MSVTHQAKTDGNIPLETAGADLHGKDLNHADMQKMDFSEANFYGANMQGALLHKANLSYALLVHADLSDADFSGAKLVLADLRNTKMTGTKLNGAEFFPEIENLTETATRLHLNNYLYQYKNDENYDLLRSAVLADLISKAQKMLNKGYRDKALGCLYAAKDHPFFNKYHNTKKSLFSTSTNSCQEIEKFIGTILKTEITPYQNK